MKRSFFKISLFFIAIFFFLTFEAWQPLSFENKKNIIEKKINYLNKKKYFTWINLSKVSKYTIQAISDSRFYKHIGVDFTETGILSS